MRVGFFACLTGMLIVFNGVSQDVEFKGSNFKDKKEELKQVLAEIESGDVLYNQAVQDVFDVKDPKNGFKGALKHYEKAQQFNAQNALLNMKLGVCHLYSNEKHKAKQYFEKAYNLNSEVDPLIDFYLGQVYALEEDFKKALTHFTKFKTSKKGEEYSKFTNEYVHSCKDAPDHIKNKQRVWVDNVVELNSEFDDFSPCISVDGETMILTSKRKNDHQPNEFGEYDEDIYTSELKNDKWSTPKNMGSLINTEKNEGSGAFAYDGQKFLMYKFDATSIDVFESELQGATWTEPKKKMENLVFTDESDETFACYEPLGIKVHYITDGGSQGGKNIFISGLMRIANRRSEWGKGQSAGHQINTKFHEGSVYIHPDGKTMYFSSQGHRSIGGYDIYKSQFVEGQWTAPVSLGYPINTPYDDLFFAGTASGKYAYIASDRPGGKGGLDIYKVTFWGPEKEPIVDSEDYLLASMANPIKEIHVSKAVKVENNSLTVFKGMVLDHLTRKPLEADIEIVDVSKNELVFESKSNSATGKFLLSLPSGKNYGITVKKEGYLFHSENFNLPDLSEFNMVNKDVELKNITVGSKIALRNVFFATGSAEVTADSYNELDRLIKLLNDVPDLKIELSGHTDNVGSESVNLKLSDDRANAVMNYLVKKGIAQSRLMAKGYGSSQPIASNNTNDGRQENRRTEFEIKAN